MCLSGNADFPLSLVFARGCINLLSCYPSSYHLFLRDAEKNWSIYIADVHLWSALWKTLIHHLSLLCWLVTSPLSLCSNSPLCPSCPWSLEGKLHLHYCAGIQIKANLSGVLRSFLSMKCENKSLTFSFLHCVFSICVELICKNICLFLIFLNQVFLYALENINQAIVGL